MLGEIGKLEWARRTNGILGRGERARYIASAVLATSRATPRLAAYRAGRRGSGPDPSALAPPDSQLARDAVAECSELMPETVIAHNYRAYLFAGALGEADGLAYDPELLFVATMYHDAGIVEIADEGEGRCFTLGGADAAATFGAAHGWDDARCDVAAEAITMHVNPATTPADGPEVHLMHDGVLMDAAGLRAWDVDPAGYDRVRERHPRSGFTAYATDKLRAQGRAIPGCRVAAAFQAGFGLALKLGPRD